MRSGVRRLAEEPEGDGGRPAGPLGFHCEPTGWWVCSTKAAVGGNKSPRRCQGRKKEPPLGPYGAGGLSHASPAPVALGFLNHRTSVGHPGMCETRGVGAGRPWALPREVLWNLPRGRPPRGHGTLRRTLPTLTLQGDAGWTPRVGLGRCEAARRPEFLPREGARRSPP